MVRGIFTAASGMKANLDRLNTVANNLANIDLNAYKRDDGITKSFPQMLIRRFNDNGVHSFPLGSVDTSPIVGRLGTGVEFNENYTVFQQGSLKKTDNPLDIALEGKGFFRVKTPYGDRYTRDGSFTLGQGGLLETKQGYPVLGQNGPIYLKTNNFKIEKNGTILYNPDYNPKNALDMVSPEVNNWDKVAKYDQISTVGFDKTRFLRKQGASLYRSTQLSGDATEITGIKRPQMRTGYVEGSNVNPVTEMVKMISINRAYESNQRAMTSQDDMTKKFIAQSGQRQY